MCQNYLEKCSNNFYKNKRQDFCKKFDTYYFVEKLCDGSVPFGSSDQATKGANSISKTPSKLLSRDGTDLKAQLLSLKSFYKEVTTNSDLVYKKKGRSDNFLEKTFAPFYRTHSEKFKGSLVFDLLKHTISVMSGNMSHHLGERLMNFSCL